MGLERERRPTPDAAFPSENDIFAHRNKNDSYPGMGLNKYWWSWWGSCFSLRSLPSQRCHKSGSEVWDSVCRLLFLRPNRQVHETPAGESVLCPFSMSVLKESEVTTVYCIYQHQNVCGHSFESVLLNTSHTTLIWRVWLRGLFNMLWRNLTGVKFLPRSLMSQRALPCAANGA